MKTETEIEKSVAQEIVSLTIDGQKISAPKETTVYQAASQLGIHIPVFCYHKRMPPFGACRMCLVEIENMPKLATSCSQAITEGMIVHTKTEKVIKGRQAMLEFLLANHPLDCPICDRGGECPLQENTILYGPSASRFTEEKREFQKPVALGPVLVLDRERCISCARCVRFSALLSGDHALKFKKRGYRTEVGTPENAPVVSKFIANTIEMCPVGALTSQVYRFRGRAWDNSTTKSACSYCGMGCSLLLDSREGELVRVRADESNVNDVWLCDKGAFGFEFVRHAKRLTKPLLRKGSRLEPVGWEEALTFITDKMKKAVGSEKTGALAGSSLTVEDYYVLQKLIREGLRSPHVDARVGSRLLALEEEGMAAGMRLKFHEIESCDVVLLLGAELTETFPVAWLRLRQAINKGAKVYFAGHTQPEIASYLSRTWLHAAGNEVVFLRENKEMLTALLKEAKKGAVLVGEHYLRSLHRQEILKELSSWQENVSLLEGAGNAMGARFAGMHPELKPFGEKAAQPGLNALGMLEAAAQTGWDFLYIVGTDLLSHVSHSLWQKARAKTDLVVVQDLFLTQTAQEADVVLPALSSYEKRGTQINVEGRIQKLDRARESDLFSDAEIAMMLGQKIGSMIGLDKLLQEKLSEEFVSLGKTVLIENLSKKERKEGLLVASFQSRLFDKGERLQHSSSAALLTTEPAVCLNGETAERFSVKSATTVMVSSAQGSFKALLKTEKGIAQNTLVIPLGFPELDVHSLGNDLYNGMSLEIKQV